MNDCPTALASTGTTGSEPAILLAAVLLVGMGVVLVAVRGHGRRGRGLPAVGLVVLLVLGGAAAGVVTPAPAGAAVGVVAGSGCPPPSSHPAPTAAPDPTPAPAPAPAPDPTPAPAPVPTEVTPTAPSLAPAAACGQEGTVQIVPTPGVEFTQSRTGTTVTVTASAQRGFVIPANVTTSWSFDVAPVPCPCTPTATLAPPEDAALLRLAFEGTALTTSLDGSSSWFTDLQAGGGSWTATASTTVGGSVLGLDADGNLVPDVPEAPWTVTGRGALPTSTDLAPTLDATAQRLVAEHPEVVQTTWYYTSVTATGTVTATYDDGCGQQTLTFDVVPGGGSGGNN
jgi:hypothetical protein